MIVTENFGTIRNEEERQMLIDKYCPKVNYDCPMVYCGTYAKYNSGSLEGRWVDITEFSDYEEFMEFLTKVLHSDEKDPELMFQDYMHFPEQWYCESSLSEETFDNILKYYEGNTDAYDAYIEATCESTLDDFDEKYCGKYESETAFAESLFDEFVPRDAPEFLVNYFDYKKYARDLFADDYQFENGYVFRRY